MVTTKDSPIVTQEHHDRWRRIPQRTKTNELTLGIRQFNIRERGTQSLFFHITIIPFGLPTRHNGTVKVALATRKANFLASAEQTAAQ